MLVDIYGSFFKAPMWMGRIKARVDPHSVSDGLYPTGATHPAARIWPMLRLTVLKMPGLLRRMMRKMIASSK